jgi:hypothetical protein
LGFSAALQVRFERTGSLNNLNDAIIKGAETLEIASSDAPLPWLYLDQMGSTYLCRFELLGSMEDVDLSVTLFDAAVDALPKDHPNRAPVLNNIARALNDRFTRTKSINDIDRAIAACEDALHAIAINDSSRVTHLSTLGSSLAVRFEQTRCLDDLSRAISSHEEAIKVGGRESPNRWEHLSNLGTAFHKKYRQTENSDDLDCAVAKMEDALHEIPADHPDRAACLTNLSGILLSHFQHNGRTENLERAASAKEECLGLEAARPSIRIAGCAQIASLLVKHDSHRAAELVRRAVGLLPSVSPRALQRHDQEHNLSEFSGLASTAAAILLEAGDDAFAVLEVLEIGRGIMSGAQLDLRSDIPLESSYPDLLSQFLQLRDQIDMPEPFTTERSKQPNQLPSFSREILRRDQIAIRFDGVIRDIRSLPGFDRFLLGPSKSELMELVTATPIVIFNAAQLRCDGIIVNNGEIRVVPLPNLKYGDLDEKTEQFYENILKTSLALKSYSTARNEVIEMLEWLWDVAVSLVLENIGIDGTPEASNQWPRIWWIGTGLFNVMLIHAAGYHNLGSTRSVLDRVISSYTPTIKALVHSKNKAEKILNVNVQHASFIAMAETPDQEDLPFVAEEVRVLSALLPSSIQKFLLETPTKEEVLAKIRQCDVVHFAMANPSSQNLHKVDCC